MDLSFSNVAAGIIFGSFGLYLLKRAKKYSRILDGLLGFSLMVFPYFIDNPWINWGLGLAMLFTAYYYRH
ncbi:MAG: hypothetical protein ACOYL6_13780 [Bacteriovoracaceae bacterium]